MASGPIQPTTEYGYQPPQTSDLAALWRRTRRYVASVIGMGIVGFLIAIFYAQAVPKIYRAAATLLIEPKVTSAVQVQEVYDSGIGTANYLNTQFEVLRSRELAARVVDQLRLTEKPDFALKIEPDLLSQLWQRLPFLPVEPISEAPEQPAAMRERIIDSVSQSVVVEPVVRTQLVKIGFDSTNPELARDIANELANVYIDSGLESRLEATRRASQWLTGKLDEIKTRLAASEKDLQNYREQAQLVVVGGDRGLLDSEILDNSQQQRNAQKKRLELQSAYEQIRSAGNDLNRLDAISSLLVSAGASQTRSSYLLAQEQLKQVEERYGAKHPQMAEARTRFQIARRAYYDQLIAAAQGLRAEYEAAALTERALSGAVAGAKTRIRDLDRKQYQASVLEREVTSNRELYELFLKRFKETDTSGSYEPINARIIEAARTPDWPYKPKPTRIYFIGLLLGLLIGAAIAWLHMGLSEGVDSATELEQITQCATLAVLPYVYRRRSRRNLGASLIEDAQSPFSESIRSLRVAIKFGEIDKAIKRIVVTSSLPAEGKSSIAAALARSLAVHKRVLLLECDLRQPTQRRMFPAQKGAPGLMELLLKQSTLDACIQKYDEDRLHVLAVGKRPPNPGEVVSSTAMRELLDQLSPNYDHIIIDTPPVQAASDVLTLSALADGVLLVVKADTTPREAIAVAVRQLRNIHARLLGSALNQVNLNRHRSYAGSYYYASRY